MRAEITPEMSITLESNLEDLVTSGIPEFLDSGLRTLDSGRWTLDAGLWSLDSGRWTRDARRYT